MRSRHGGTSSRPAYAGHADLGSPAWSSTTGGTQSKPTSRSCSPPGPSVGGPKPGPAGQSGNSSAPPAATAPSRARPESTSSPPQTPAPRPSRSSRPHAPRSRCALIEPTRARSDIRPSAMSGVSRSLSRGRRRLGDRSAGPGSAAGAVGWWCPGAAGGRASGCRGPGWPGQVSRWRG